MVRDRYKPHHTTILLGLLNIKLNQIPRKNKYSLGALGMLREKALTNSSHNDTLTQHTPVSTLHVQGIFLGLE